MSQLEGAWNYGLELGALSTIDMESKTLHIVLSSLRSSLGFYFPYRGSCTPVLHTCLAHLSCTLVLHTCLAHMSCTPVLHTCLAHLSCTPVLHTCLAHLSRTPVLHTCLAHLRVVCWRRSFLLQYIESYTLCIAGFTRDVVIEKRESSNEVTTRRPKAPINARAIESRNSEV